MEEHFCMYQSASTVKKYMEKCSRIDCVIVFLHSHSAIREQPLSKKWCWSLPAIAQPRDHPPAIRLHSVGLLSVLESGPRSVMDCSIPLQGSSTSPRGLCAVLTLPYACFSPRLNQPHQLRTTSLGPYQPQAALGGTYLFCWVTRPGWEHCLSLLLELNNVQPGRQGGFVQTN